MVGDCEPSKLMVKNTFEVDATELFLERALMITRQKFRH